MLSPIVFPPELPISQRKEEIIAAIQRHQVIVLSGETGSGKTTQIPKMCLEAGLGSQLKIACTQPRRVAALSVAKRVAEELGVAFGAEVGAKIRFTDQTSRKTRIKFMTDGMLLSEIHGDPLMRDYEAIIVDEAHERSLNIDFLLGHLNQLRHRRPELKIIITSATIDTERFSQAFDAAPIIEVSGRVYPVEVIYAPLDELLEESGDFTYLEGIAESVDRIQREFGPGDILAFLPTEKDIREAMDLLQSRCGHRMEIIPCFGRLSNADQQRIFQSASRRKLVLATNIAETSLTIPGIRFVIDTGLARISRYNPRARTQRLPIVKVSQSSANQRKGRCGRVADGVCIRLYAESDFESRPVYTVPEIQRANLADVILRMLASRLGDVETFPFIDPPAPSAIAAGYTLLEELNALAPAPASPRPDRPSRRLTPLGRQLSKLPVDPTVGRMLLEAQRHHVLEEILVIASALSIQDPRERPMEKEAAARQAHARFSHPHSDFLTLLNIWNALHNDLERLSQSKLRQFCKQHFLNYLRIREWRDIYEQLKRALPNSPSSSPTAQNPEPKTQPTDLDRGSAAFQAIHSCLLTGLLANAGRREETNLYRFSANRKALLFPGSTLFVRQAPEKRQDKGRDAATAKPKRKGPEWVMAGELVETSRLFARTVAAIDPRWLVTMGAHILQRSYSEPQFLASEGRVVARESLRIHGLEIQNRQVSYLKVDPDKATEIFIREALLNEEFEAPANWSFLEPNRRLIRRIQNAQTVISVAHWMGVEEAAFRFYRKRLANVASIHDLNRFLKSAEPPLLSETDLTLSADAAVDLSLFPESVQLDNSALPIEYQYKHGHEKDGVTLKLPYSKAGSVSNALLDWLIPGHLEPKIHALLKALPKDARQRLFPLAETAKTIARELRPTGQSLTQSLAQHLAAHYSLETYASDWDQTAIPEHLRARVEIVDQKGRPVAEGRDVETLRKQLAATEAELSHAAEPDTAALWRKARQRHERPIDSVSDLPASDATEARLTIGHAHGIPIHAYPALRAVQTSPSPLVLSLLRSSEEAALANQRGIATLIEHECRRELAWIQKDLKAVEQVGPVAVSLRPMQQLKQDVYEHIRRAIRHHNLTRIDATAIARAAAGAKTRCKGLLYQVVDQTKAALEKRQQLVLQTELVKRFGHELDQLLPPDFLPRTPDWALPRLPLYLECLQRRDAARAKDPLRYQQREKELRLFQDRYAELARANPAAADDPYSGLGRLRFTLQEFAVSLFAQNLGTAFPISAKKLESAFSELVSALGSGPLAVPAPRASPATSHTTTPSARPPARDRPTQASLESLKNLFG